MMADHEPMVLLGEKDLRVSMLPSHRQTQGSSDESAIQRAQVREAYIKGEGEGASETFRVDTFSGARWEFHADDTISFQPSVTDPMGLYPLIGRFAVTESGITFHVSKQASAGVAVTLDGILRPSERGYSLVAINTTAGRSGLHIDRISQQLDLSPGKEPAAERLIGGISLPSAFAVSIMGTTDGTEVGPVAGTLTIEPADSEGPYPLLISLSSPDLTVPGAIQWTVSPALAPQAKVSIANGLLTLEVEFDQPGLLLWIAAVPESPIPDLALPFAIRHGRMVLAVDRDKVSGSLVATGVSPVFENREGTYNVQFTGQRQEEKGAVPTHPEQDPALDSRHLQFPVFDLDFPIFDITLNGETERGTFEDLAATLIISRTEPEVFELTLATEGPTCNGWIAWTSESLDRITHLQGNRITAAYPDDAPDVSWWTGDGTSVDLAYAIPERARIAIIIGQDGEITGTIEGTGNAAVHEQLKPSFYRANFAGHWRGRAVDRLRKTLNQVGLNGSWQDTGAFGTLVIHVENGHLSGVFGSQGDGTLAGDLQNRYADFTWRDQSGHHGWGFLALAANREALVGLWGASEGTGEIGNLVAVRTQPLDLDLCTLTQKDVTELRYLGRELVSQGRLELGAKVLERALKLEEDAPEAAGPNVSLREGNLVERAVILADLVPADFQIPDYEKLVDHMARAVTVRRLLGPEEFAKGVYQQQISELENELRSEAESLGVVVKNLADFQKGVDDPSLAADLAATQAHLRGVTEDIAGDAGDIASLLIYREKISRGQRSPLKVLDDVVRLATARRDSILRGIDDFLAFGNETFVKQGTLLSERNALLAALQSRWAVNIGPSGLADLARQERDLLDELNRATTLSKAEKTFFDGQLNMGSYLVSIANSLGVRAKHIERLRVGEQMPKRSANAERAAADLARYLEWWRARLVLDQDKKDLLKMAEPFLKKQVGLLVELDAGEHALVASEAARSRALADLLAARPHIKQDLDQVFVSKGLLPSPASVPPLTIEEIRAIACSQGGTLVEYFLLEDGIAAWVLCPKGEIKTIHIPLDVTRLMDNVRRLAELMSEGLSGQLGRQRRDEAAALLHRLNAALIEPLDDKGLLPVVPNELITIIPHGVLFGVPFAALRDKTGRYFIEKHSVAYATALSVLKYARQDKGGTTYRWPPRLVALVNPNPLPDPSRKPLSDTETFFPRIAALYGDQDNTQVYPGPKATAETLNRSASQADVLYFATHAQANEEEPLESFIAMAKTDSHSGYLRIPEIYALNVCAELVILAACETGRGTITGDGVDGLSRAFTWAGARTLLLTLWTVPELQTLELLYNFHRYWIEGRLTKALALREAQLQRLRIYRDQPNVWSGFALYGEPH